MMKKISKIIIVFLSLIIFVTSSSINAKAETQSEYNDVNFIGNIVPVRKFYKGEYTEYYDYKITGDFVDRDDNIIPNSEWKIFAIDTTKKDKIKIVIKHLPTLSDETDLYYNDIEYIVDIKTEEFDENLNVNIKKNIKANTVEEALNKLKFYNSLGNRVKGEIKHEKINNSDSKIIKIKYTFTPYKPYVFTDYGYEQYKCYEGVLNINISDK